jgi:hypothetical protein
MSKEHCNSWEVNLFLEPIVNPPLKVLVLGYG